MEDLHSVMKYKKSDQSVSIWTAQIDETGIVSSLFLVLNAEIDDSSCNIRPRLICPGEAHIQMSGNGCSFIAYFQGLTLIY